MGELYFDLTIREINPETKLIEKIDTCFCEMLCLASYLDLLNTADMHNKC